MNPIDVQITNPDITDLPSDAEIDQPFGLTAQWQTPGLYMAQRISTNKLVRFVGEKYESDYLQPVVVLDEDPDDILDSIFSIEQEMYKEFGTLRFDVRVRVIPKDENIDLIKSSSVAHFDRDFRADNV